MNKVQSLYSFWASFNLTPYDETSVPDSAELPYITYDTVLNDFGTDTAMTASLWYRSTSWQEITEKQEEIAKALGHGGMLVEYDGGAMWIRKGTPWAQRMSDSSDDMVRRIVLNVEVEFIDY